MKNIIIVGAGFGGITAAIKLSSKLKGRKLDNEYGLILVDRHHHQLYTPALYEIASIPRENAYGPSLKSSILIPLTDMVEKGKMTFVCDELIGLKKQDKKIVLRDTGEMPYEFLVLALGSETNYFNIPGLKEHGLPLKTYDDAARMRNSIEKILKTKDELKIVVGGAGASGIELVAEFVNFICSLKDKALGGKNVCLTRFVLVDAAPEILSGFDPWIVQKTKKRLQKLGIEIKTGIEIVSVNDSEILFKSGAKENYNVFIWTGGVKGPSVLQKFGLPLSNKGSLIVDEYLRADGAENIFAIGDCSHFINPATGKPLVWNVPVAETEGKVAAKNIVSVIQREQLKKFVPPVKYPYILAIGRKYAIADLVYFKICGFWGWFIKQLVELRYLLFILPIKKAIPTWLKSMKYFTSND